MGKKKEPSIEIPPAPQQRAPTYDMPGWGQSWFDLAKNTYGFTETPERQAERLQIDAMRRAILSGLGITTPQREASLKNWADVFTNEALRTSMPQLEQTMFARGMGGSRLYQDAITNLLSKVATQATLSKEDLARQDEALKLQQLASIAGLSQEGFSNIANLLGMTTQQGNVETQMDWEQYKTLLPYLIKYNAGKESPWGTIGSLAGAGAGFLLGGPMGAGIGSTLGGTAGGFIGGSPSQVDLSWLSMLPQATRTPVSPMLYNV